MANALHHHDVRTFDVPWRVYLAAAIGLALLALLLVFSSTTASNTAATATYLSDPVPPFMPLVPIL